MSKIIIYCLPPGAPLCLSYMSVQWLMCSSVLVACSQRYEDQARPDGWQKWGETQVLRQARRLRWLLSRFGHMLCWLPRCPFIDCRHDAHVHNMYMCVYVLVQLHSLRVKSSYVMTRVWICFFAADRLDEVLTSAPLTDTSLTGHDIFKVPIIVVPGNSTTCHLSYHL